MSQIIPQSNTLNQWIKRLDNTRLPVCESHRERALQVLKNSNKSLREIVQVISQAPIIPFIIMREANRHSSSFAEPVQNLESALSRLGMQRCVKLVNSLTATAESSMPKALRQVLLLGQHLNVQALGLFGTRMARLKHEIHVSSLLFLAPAWPLLTRQPELLEQWEQRVLGSNEPAEQVENELIGLPLTTLCLALAEHWKLPEWIIEGYRLLSENPQLLVSALHVARETQQPLLQQQKLDEQPALNTWLNRPANTVVFACGLVLAAHSSWGNEQCIRWQRLISLYLKEELADIQQITHQLAVKHARLQQHHDLWQPAQALLWPWNTERLKHHKPQLNTAPTATPASASAPQDGLSRWRRHCAELLKSPSPFHNSWDLTQGISLALQACGLQRICIVLLNKQAHYAKVSQLHGIQAEQLPDSFALPANPVIAHLLKQATHIVLCEDNAARISPHLPAELNQLFSKHNWILASLTNGQRVVMLIAADQSQSPLQPRTLQGFKKTLECAEQALRNFSTRSN